MSKHYSNYSVLLCMALVSLLPACTGPVKKEDKPSPYPVAVTATYTAALASMKQGQEKTAIQEFEKLARNHPSLAGVHTNLGILYLKAKRLEQAEQSLTRSIQLNPNNPVSHNYLGIVYRHLGRFEDAQRSYTTALKINDNYAFAHLNLGILYDLYLFDLQAALRHYLRYQTLTANQDKLVEKWIVDIKRRDTARNQEEVPRG